MAVGKEAHAPRHRMDPGTLQLLDSSKLQLGENVIFTVFHLPAAHWVEGCADNHKHLYTCSFDHSSHVGKLRHRVVKRLACASYRQATHKGHADSLDLLLRAF